MQITDLIVAIPEGYSSGIYKNKKYGINKTVFNQGKSVKIFARELSGNDFISLNFYKTKNREYLKPCEMPAEKVILFLKEIMIDL